MTSDPRQRSTLVPIWLERSSAVAWRVLVTVGLGFVLVTIAIGLSSVTASILVALIAAAVLAPIARRMRARGASSTVAAAVASLVGLAVLAAGLTVVILALLPYASAIGDAVEAGINDIRDQLARLGAPAVVTEAVDRLESAIGAALAVDPARLLGPAAAVGTVAILGGFLTFFLLQDGDRAWATSMRSIDPWRAGVLTASAREGVERVGGYLGRTALLAAADAVVLAVVLFGLGVPLAGPLVVMVFLGGFIPFLGAIITTAIVVLATLAFAGPEAAVIVSLVMAATSLIADRLLRNTPLGPGVDVHPLLVLIAIPAGAALFGVLGLMALLPLIVFVLAVSRSLIITLDHYPDDPSAAPMVPRSGVPIWLDRLAQWSWRGLAVIGLLWLVIQAAVSVPIVIVPAVLAFVLAATIAPLATRLHRLGWSRGVAAGAATAGSALIVVAAAAISVVWTVGPLRDLVETAIEGADDLDLGALSEAVESLGSSVIVDLSGLLRGLVALTLALVLGLLLTFFFVRDGAPLWRFGMARVRPSLQPALDQIASRTVHVLGGYMIGTAIIALFGAVTSSLTMIVLGLPLAIPVGILTFFGGFIPYIGSFLTTALATLIAVAVGTTTDVAVMLIFTVVFNIVQGNFVTPIVYGRTLNLHPAVILLAVPAGNEVAGILGMFLVVPFVAIVAATWRPLLVVLAEERAT